MSADEDQPGPGATRAHGGRAVLLAVRFATERALLVVLAVAGASASAGLAWRICLAVVAPVLAAVIWGLLIAPAARRRLPDPWRLTVEVVLFPPPRRRWQRPVMSCRLLSSPPWPSAPRSWSG